MKFRTKLTFFPLGVFFISCMVVLYMIATWSDMRSLFQRVEQVTEIFESIDEIQYLLKEYDRAYDIEYLKQLEQQQKSLQLFLSQLATFPPPQQTLINSIVMTSRSMDRKVLYLLNNGELETQKRSKAMELMMEKLFINLEVIRENSYQLNTHAAQEIRSKSKQQILIVTLVLFASSAIFLLLSMNVYQKLDKYLRAMNKGLQKVRKGNLESPIHVDKNNDHNELSEFIDEFNKLSHQLLETMVSRDELQQIIDQRTHSLKQLADTDSLTQVCNRRKLLIDANNEVERARRYSHDLSLLIIDADDFKQINDLYGHYTGDQVLIKLCRIFEQKTRSVDVIGRYGGEEFIILLPETSHSKALEMAERIRHSVSEHSFFHEEERIAVTISIGVATLSDETDLITLINKADQALYKAKHLGKNTIQSSE